MVSDSKSVLFHRDWLDSLTIYCHPFDYVHKDFDWWHHHNFDELVIVRSGEGLHVTENGTYRIHKGDTFMIKKEIFTVTRSCRIFESSTLHFIGNTGLTSAGNLSIRRSTRLFSKTV
ncbi:MAG: AraC family ligand binding domain-containing protein [Lentisphaeria bacterium]|nr:MAG: AraC family ligand binding domain-containing protein [Lentisphaeria bacterium]